MKFKEVGATKKKKIDFSKEKWDMSLPFPNLIEIQKESYSWFLQADKKPENKKRQGLQEAFKDIFPVYDFTGNLIIDFDYYTLGLGMCKGCPESMKFEQGDCRYFDCCYKEKACEIVSLDSTSYRIKYLPNECRKRDVTYGIPLQIRVRLINKSTGEIKEQEIFVCNLPLMTNQGSYVINGADRVVVSQLHRSPGVYYAFDKVKKNYGAKVVPYRGAWLELELNVVKDIIHVRLDRKRKVPVTALIRSLGYRTDEEIMTLFNNNEYIANSIAKDKAKTYEQGLEEIYSRLRPGEPFTEESALQIINMLFFDERKYDLGDVGRYKINTKLRLSNRIKRKITAETIFRSNTGEIVCEPGEQIDEELALKMEDTPEAHSVMLKTLDGREVRIANERPYETISLVKERKTWEKALLGQRLSESIIDLQTGELVADSSTRVSRQLFKKLEELEISVIRIIQKEREVTLRRKTFMSAVKADAEYEDEDIIIGRLLGRELYESIINPLTGEVMIPAGEEVNRRIIDELRETGIKKVVVFKARVLSPDDIIGVIRYIIDLSNGIGTVDDIDHLGNRRVRRCGELLQNQFRMSLARLERDVRERMTIQDSSGITPQTLINTRPIAAAVKDFFGSSQLSQFMDQTNPLAELTHKRRLSALGPGGLRRERAGYEVRDVHPTHFGRICPIETPEGPNAGLISSMAVYAHINRYGFIETPCLRIRGKSQITDRHFRFMTAHEEDDFIVATSDVAVNAMGKILDEAVPVKYVKNEQHEFDIVPVDEVDYLRVSPLQTVSVAASLIPFLEHDDANRALMGTNMQRQAVPLLKTETPRVCTGMEYRAAVDSGATVICEHGGRVIDAAANKILVWRDSEKGEERLRVAVAGNDKFSSEVFRRIAARTVYNDVTGEIIVESGYQIDYGVVNNLKEAAVSYVEVHAGRTDSYPVMKFSRSNQGTCINQRPLVTPGMRVAKGQVLADGHSTSEGELALGKNILVAFMPWEGYNFEDAILLSERLVKEDIYTSIHIEEFEIEARDTKLGPEEITRDIPNISEEALKDLDTEGIIRVGAEVGPGDILVGKVTPKGYQELTAEDKLLRAIFGEKAREVRNTSFVVPHGEGGKVVDVMVFCREKKDELPHGVNKLVRVFIAQKRKILEGDKMAGRHGNKGVIAKIVPEQDMPYLENGTPCDIVLNPLGVPSRMNVGQILEAQLGWVSKMLGYGCQTPVFNGAREEELDDLFVIANLINSGQVELYYKGEFSPFACIKFHRFDQSLIRKAFLEKSFPQAFAYLLKKLGGDFVDVIRRHVVIGEIISDTPKKNLEKAIETGDLRSVITLFQKIPEGAKDTSKVEPIGAIQIWDYDDQEEVKEELISKKQAAAEAEQDEKRDQGEFPEYYQEIGSSEYSEPFIANALKKDVAASVYTRLSEVIFIKPLAGKMTVYDGRTGEPFDHRILVGSIYMMKLAHLVEDKIHARATGPYSLVTQQPLGGKAQFGGQRFGEMEVWALEAYGAAHTLQELLTVKSDDVEGRVEVYEAIIKGERKIRPRIPESFKVLVSELRSLGLKVELQKSITKSDFPSIIEETSELAMEIEDDEELETVFADQTDDGETDGEI